MFELAERADLAVLGFEATTPGAYGRLILDGDRLSEIVEAREASKEQLAIRACNSGVIACDRARLFSLLDDVKNENSKHEYYLTDVVAIARGRGLQPRATMALGKRRQWAPTARPNWPASNASGKTASAPA